MNPPETSTPSCPINQPSSVKHRRGIIVDCLILLVLSALSQGTAFSQRMGRAKVYSDSYQYIAQAQSLGGGPRTPAYELRKHGYPLFLAGVSAWFGQQTWKAIIANHLLCALLPLAAFGLGLLLKSRMLGWLVAVGVMARIQFLPFPDMIMSETLYMVLLSFGLLALCAALLDLRRSGFLATSSGLLLGAAWFTRSAAIAPIVVATAALLVWYEANRLRTDASADSPRLVRAFHIAKPRFTIIGSFLIPILGFWFLECSMNYHVTGRYETCHSAAGINLFTARLCRVQGVRPPPTPAVRALQNLLPERSAEEAFRMTLSDQWVALTRALRDRGLDSSQFGALCAQAGWDSIRSDIPGYLRSTLWLAGNHLLRTGNLDPPTWLPTMVPICPIGMASIHPSIEERIKWSGRWCLAQMSPEEGIAFVRRINDSAGRRAPLDRFGMLRSLRFIRSLPSIVNVLNISNGIAYLWPGFALLLCGWLGLRRSVCLILAATCVGDALLHAMVVFTNYRYQGVWLVTDTVLAAAIPLALTQKIILRVRLWRTAILSAIVPSARGRVAAHRA